LKKPSTTAQITRRQPPNANPEIASESREQTTNGQAAFDRFA